MSALVRSLLGLWHSQPPQHGLSTAARKLAHNVLRGADYDFGTVQRSSSVLVARPDRHGVRVLVVPTSGLPESALAAILAWRLGQYLLTGFYDADGVARSGMRGESRELVGPDDLHALAIDKHGALLCYATVKQPHGAQQHTWGAADRPLTLDVIPLLVGKDTPSGAPVVARAPFQQNVCRFER